MLNVLNLYSCIFYVAVVVNSAPIKAAEINEQVHTPIIAYYGAFKTVDFWSKLSQAINDEASIKGGFILDYTKDQYSKSEQLMVFENAVKNKVDGFILGQSFGKINESIDLIEKADIPVVLVNEDISHPWVKSVIMTNNEKAAELAAKYLHEQIKKQRKAGSKIIIITGDKANAIARTRAKVSADYLNMKGSYDIKTFYIPNWDGKKAFEKAHDQLKLLGEDVAGIFATYAPASIAVTLAAEATNTSPVLMGFDLNDSMKELITRGGLVGAVAQDPKLMGEKSIEILFKVLNGEPVDRHIYLTPSLVTKETLSPHGF